jgi:hypothetical protein
MNNDERETMSSLAHDANDIPLLDRISGREVIVALYKAGLIEMPYMFDPYHVEITSCPVDPEYTLRDDLPAYNTIPVESDLCVTDYDGPVTWRDGDEPLHQGDRLTTRIGITLGEA